MDAENCWRCGATMEWRHGTWQCGICKLKLGCCEGEAQTNCESQAPGSTHKTVYIPDSEGTHVPLPLLAGNDRIVG